MLTFEGFTGINNVIPAHRLSKTDLVRGNDVDIGLTGEIQRRGGYTEASDQCHKNVWAGQGFMLATCGAVLTAIHPSGARHVIHPSLGHSRVWYCNLPDGRTTFTNGLIHGMTDGLTRREWSVSSPSVAGSAKDVPGALQKGTYSRHLTFRRVSDGAESAAVSAPPVQIDLGGIYLSGLPTLDGHELLVYLSTPDGEGAYLAGSTTTDEFLFTGAANTLVLPCRTLGARPFPVGTYTGFWRGRVLVAQDNVLWASRANAPHLSDWRDFKQFPSRITAVQPVDDGVYVGTEKDLVFLSGTTWDQLAFVPTQRGPVVPGSGVTAPGDRVKLGDGSGAGTAMLCIAGSEIVAGFGGGQTTSLTGDRYKSTATEVCATFREVNGIPQYLAIPQ